MSQQTKKKRSKSSALLWIILLLLGGLIAFNLFLPDSSDNSGYHKNRSKGDSLYHVKQYKKALQYYNIAQGYAPEDRYVKAQIQACSDHFTTTFSTTFGKENTDDYANAIIATKDGGYVIAGSSSSYGAGNTDAWILKLDATGQVDWRRLYGGKDKDEATGIVLLPDGGYMVAGYTRSTRMGDADAWILILNERGRKVSERQYGDYSTDVFLALSPMKKNRFAAVGFTETDSTKTDMLIFMLDATGDSLWTRSLGGSLSDIANSVVQSSDGNMLVGGHSLSFSNGNSDAWIVQLNPHNGEVLWQRNFGNKDAEVSNGIASAKNGACVFVGSSFSFGKGKGDLWLTQLDKNGYKEWQKSIGGTAHDNGTAITACPKGGYIVTGYTESYGKGAKDLWLLRFDEKGNLIWRKEFGGKNQDIGKSVSVLNDGGFAIAGYQSMGKHKNLWILKTDKDGLLNKE